MRGFKIRLFASAVLLSLGSSITGVGAQEAAVTAPMQIIGPLYAYGPSPGAMTEYLAPTYRPRYRDRYGDGRPTRQRYYGGFRNRDRYANDRSRWSPRYANRYRPWNSDSIDRYRGRQDRVENRFPARIITPRWTGQWRELGPVRLIEAN